MSDTAFYKLKNGNREVDYDFRMEKDAKTDIILGIATDIAEVPGHVLVHVVFQDGEVIGDCVLSREPNPMVIYDQLDYWIANRDMKTPWPPDDPVEPEPSLMTGA